MKFISVSKGKYWATVDDEDFEYLSQFTWHLAKGGYAGRWEYPGQKRVLMHRELVEYIPVGMRPDHKNGDRLDNRKENLRIGTVSQNNANRHKYSKPNTYKGVLIRRHRFKTSYTPVITGIHLGALDNEHIAALMYDFWAVDKFGEFAFTNFKVVSWGP